MEPLEELRAVAAEVRNCRNCRLCETRTLAVPGEGPVNAHILFIGEGPGANEDAQGRPFVGAAGRLLDEMLEAAYLKRKDVFICNVVKCRPPGNRDPEPDEILACGKYLDRQIDAIHPKVIVTLGRFSMAKFFPNARISQIHGRASRVGDYLVVAMYHPAAALHQPTLRPELERDFTGLDRYLHPEKYTGRTVTAAPQAEANPAPESTQTNLPHSPQDTIESDTPDDENEDNFKQLSLF